MIHSTPARSKDFNIWYVLIGIFANVYGYKSWQCGFAFNSCALNAHEAKMAGILGYWRGQGRRVMYTLLSLCAYTYLRHPDFAAGAAAVHQTLNAIPEDQDPRADDDARDPWDICCRVGVRGVWWACDLPVRPRRLRRLLSPLLGQHSYPGCRRSRSAKNLSAPKHFPETASLQGYFRGRGLWVSCLVCCSIKRPITS